MSSSASDGGEVGNDPRSSSDSLPGSVGSDTSDGGDLSSSSSSSSNTTTPSPANTSGDLSSSSASASSSSNSSSLSSASSSSSGSSSLGLTEASGSGLGAGAIVGITIGALAVLLAVILIIRRRRRARRLGKDSTSSHNPTDPTTSENAGFTGDFTAFQHPDVIVKADYAQFPGVPFAPVKQVKFASSASSTAGMWEDPEIVAVRIPKDKVHYQSLISRGAYGEVYRGSYNGQPVAIKMLLPETRKDLNLINSFLAEAKLTSTMDHPRVVSFVGVAWDSLTDLCVVSEFMAGGDLRALLSLYESTRQVPTGFNADKTRIALHVAHALTYLHSLLPMVLHRDLKSRNILLDSELNAKLTDFGVSRESSDRTMTAGIGTLLWMAPEVMMGERYDDKADMFSFGVVLAELDSHSLPYAFAKRTDSGRVLPDAAMLQLVAVGQLSIRFSDDVPDEIAALGRACTSLDPTQRPTAGEALYELQKAQKRYVAESW